MMKRFISLALCLSFSHSLWADASCSLSAAAENMDSVLGIAHRGCWENAPENSLEALSRCLELGMSMAEVDVLATADGTLVLMHDTDLQRTTGVPGLVAEKTYADIQDLRLRNRAGGEGEAFTANSIPTLEEAMDLVGERMILVLDLKADVAEQVMALVEEKQFQDRALFLWLAPLDGFSGSSLAAAQPAFLKPSVRPGIASDALSDAEVSELLERYLALKPWGLTLSEANPQRLEHAIERLHDAGVLVWISTLHQERQPELETEDALQQYWQELIDRGVNLIQTDRASALAPLLDSDCGLNEPGNG